jgi:hypothetical protein
MKEFFMPQLEKDQNFSSPFETVKVSEKAPAWMNAFNMSGLPELKGISSTTNLPIISDRSFARTAIAMGDTQQGALNAMLDGVDVTTMEKDPRVEQLRRMIKRDQGVFTSEPNSQTLSLSAPAPGKEKQGVLGVVTSVNEKEVSGSVLGGFISKEIKDRSAGLPQHLRGRMKALEQMSQSIQKSRTSGSIDDKTAFAALADVSERAFLVSEGGKSPERRTQERRESKVDPLFAASAHATRSASRLTVEDSFKNGLVSDVMIADQTQRLEGTRGLRKGDDFGSISKRLNRLGLIPNEDPRLSVKPETVATLMKEPPKVRDDFEAASAREMMPPEGHAEKAVKENREKMDAKIKHEKPPEATAPTSVQQIGLSGAYMAQEISRDNKNAFEDKEKIAKLKEGYEKSKKQESPFSQAGVLEASALHAHKAGRDPKKVEEATTAVAVRANTGVTQVSTLVNERILQKKKPPLTKTDIQR